MFMFRVLGKYLEDVMYLHITQSAMHITPLKNLSFASNLSFNEVKIYRPPSLSGATLF